MRSFTASALVGAGLVASASAFDANSKTNVVTYWGQGPNQLRLLETCKNQAVDIVVIGFVNQFPDQTGNAYPGDNFGNACYGDYYQINGKDTSLLKTCPNIGPDVVACQQTYGKKVFLSIGGGYPTNYYLKSDASGKSFADFLWGAFGPVTSSWTGPRPWGNAVVDGFDFDIESGISPAPSDTPNYLTSGYAAMINHLHSDLYPTDTSKAYYISGAPQCVLPDTHFTSVMKSAWYDFMFVQFYNTPQCSARAGIQHQQGTTSNDISFIPWTQSQSLNPNVKYYLGVPANTAAAGDSSYYLNLQDLQSTVQRFSNQNLLGGIMTWEATYARTNRMCSKDYNTWSKDFLLAAAAGRQLDYNTSGCTDDANATPLAYSPDGSCGGSNNYACAPGQCCSQYGYCGTTSDFCGTGCNKVNGVCWLPGTFASSTTSKSSTTTSKSSTTTSKPTTTTAKTTMTTSKRSTTTTTSKRITTTAKAAVKNNTPTTSKKSSTFKTSTKKPTTTKKPVKKAVSTKKVTSTKKPVKKVTSTRRA